MKRLISTLSLGAILAVSASADYKLILTDKEGNQTEECVKSYSFSSEAKQAGNKQGMGQEVYSEDETLTNKVWLGKPVYRKVFKYDNLIFNNQWHYIKFDESLNIDEVIDHTYMWKRNTKERDNLIGQWDDGGANVLDFYTINGGWGYALGTNRPGSGDGGHYTGGITFSIEYTKITDTVDETAIDSSNAKYYVNYVRSSSKKGKTITKSLNKGWGVQFFKGYRYDSSTESCEKK